MAFPFRQTNFAGGYVSPALYGRTDQAKYQAGAAELRNCVVQRSSGIENRSGSLYCGQSKLPSFQGIPFITSIVESFSLEAGAGYVRVWQDGEPLSAVGCPAFAAGGYTPPGQIVSSGGGYWYCLEEQFGANPGFITISGSSYAAGSQVNLTAAWPMFTQLMAYSGMVVTFQQPGGPICRVTLNAYTSGTVVSGTVDSAVPASLQCVGTMDWTATTPTLGGVTTGGVPITITITGTYNAGSTLTLTASAPLFSNEMKTGSQQFTFYTSLGNILVTINGYSSGTSATGICTAGIPPEIQDVPTTWWNNPNTLGSYTFSPVGPQFPGGQTVITITSSTGFSPQQTLTLTASAYIFNVGMVGLGVTFHDTLGNVFTATITNYVSPTVVMAESAAGVPVTMQNAPTAFWSLPQVFPGAAGSSQYWYELPTTQVEIPTFIPAAAIGSLWYAQATDIMTLTHQLMAPVQVLHYSDSRWLLQPYVPAVSILPPTTVLATIGYSSTLHTFAYAVTAVSAATGEESLASPPAMCLGNFPSSTLPNLVTWSPVLGAKAYNIYSLSGGVFGLIGSTTGTNGLMFTDIGDIPDEQVQPPVLIPMFQTPDDYPAVCGYFQQREILANSLNQPQSLWMSRVGQLYNYCESTPLVDNDAIQATLAGNEVQPIQAVVGLQKLVIHTTTTEFICAGNAFGALSPVSGINAAPESNCGAAAVRPIPVGITDIFVQARGTQVRDLRFDIRSYCYNSTDLTIWALDLFTGRTIVQMAWQQVPNSIVWFVMSDGSLLSMTFNRDQEVTAWATHDTGQGDIFTQVWVVREGNQDVVYVGVNRLVQGASVSYIERLAQRDFVDTSWLTDAFFADSFQVYDGRNTTSTILTVTSQTGGWTSQDVFTITANSNIFAATDAPAGNPQGVGNTIILRQVNSAGVDTARVSFSIVGYTDGRHVTCTVGQTVPTWAQQPTTVWGKAIHAFTGWDHLDGRALSVLGDGSVMASPLSPDPFYSANPVVVAGGAWVMPLAAPGVDPNRVNCMVVCAGLPVIAELTTLPLENQKGDTILGKQKVLKEMVATLYNSRGTWYGQLNELGQVTKLQSWKQRCLELLATPTSLFSGSIRIDGILSSWGTRGAGTGQLVIQQPDPVPMGISGLTMLADVGN